MPVGSCPTRRTKRRAIGGLHISWTEFSREQSLQICPSSNRQSLSSSSISKLPSRSASQFRNRCCIARIKSSNEAWNISSQKVFWLICHTDKFIQLPAAHGSDFLF